MSRYLIVLAVVIAVTGAANATTVSVPAEFREIVTDAALIVRGRVVATTPVRSAAGDVSTIATVQVSAVLKGQADGFVSVLVPGGRVGRVRSVMVGAPRLETDDVAVFLLQRGADGLWRPVGLAMGVFRVGANASTGRAEIRPPLLAERTASAGAVVHGDRRRTPLSLQEFDALVRIAMAPPAPVGRSPR
jgi:hypothetical protein